MRKPVVFLTILIVMFLLGCYSRPGVSTRDTVPHKEEIKPYVVFLSDHQTNPVDYVMGLFEKYDLVILCERFHPEVSQYDLILEIVRDNRFIENVKHVFTETGSRSNAAKVENYLTHEFSSEVEAEVALEHIYRDLNQNVLWNNTNYYQFLKQVYTENQSLTQERKAHVYPVDLTFSWEGMTREGYRAFREDLRQRDQLMADQITTVFNDLAAAEGRKKALVIMNYRHAFPHLEIRLRGRTKTFNNVGGYLMATYPGRVANVMLNSVKLLLTSTDNRAVFTAIQDGKWDAASRVYGNPAVGFDFAGSPFGADPFDYFPVPSDYTYQDVFNGFIFYLPLEEHRISRGLPQLIDAPFEIELARRRRIIDQQITDQELAEWLQKVKNNVVSGYSGDENFIDEGSEAAIARWLEQ